MPLNNNTNSSTFSKQYNKRNEWFGNLKDDPPPTSSNNIELNTNVEHIIEYMGQYFVLPKKMPGELIHLGQEAHRRYNWNLAIYWYNNPEAHSKLTTNCSENKFSKLSNKLRHNIEWHSISTTLQELSPFNNTYNTHKNNNIDNMPNNSNTPNNSNMPNIHNTSNTDNNDTDNNNNTNIRGEFIETMP